MTSALLHPILDLPKGLADVELALDRNRETGKPR